MNFYPLISKDVKRVNSRYDIQGLVQVGVQTELSFTALITGHDGQVVGEGSEVNNKSVS